MDQPIGLFDSGFGGLTVLKELIRLLPQENFIYLGDTAGLPYGNKSPATIIQYAKANAQFLLKFGIKLLIIPCHTACCHALDILEKELPIPVVGVIKPGLELVRSFQRIAVLGTTSTIESGLYQHLILKQNPEARVIAKACPLFVPLIEAGLHEHEATTLIAKESLQEIKGQVDAVLLACTHYPLMRKVLEAVTCPNIALLEPAYSCAEQALQILTQENKLRKTLEKPTHQFFVTDDPEKFQKIGTFFFENPIESVRLRKS